MRQLVQMQVATRPSCGSDIRSRPLPQIPESRVSSDRSPVAPPDPPEWPRDAFARVLPYPCTSGGFRPYPVLNPAHPRTCRSAKTLQLPHGKLGGIEPHAAASRILQKLADGFQQRALLLKDANS